jgi:hypothetical protein
MTRLPGKSIELGISLIYFLMIDTCPSGSAVVVVSRPCPAVQHHRRADGYPSAQRDWLRRDRAVVGERVWVWSASPL